MPGAGYDISAATSQSTTQGLQSGGAFTVGGDSGSRWTLLALVIFAGLAALVWLNKRK